MKLTTDLIDRLSTETGRRLGDLARRRRKQALARLTRHFVVVTDDGITTRETMFEQPPTLGQLIDRVGADVFVVAVRLQRKSLRARVRQALAAE